MEAIRPSLVPAYYDAIFKDDITKISKTRPGLVVEYWHDALMDGFLVPPLSWQAREFIYGKA